MTTSAQSKAGPSCLPVPHPRPAPRKPRAPHPSTLAQTKRRKLPPPLPAKPSPYSRPGTDIHGNPTLPIKTLQGVGTRRTDTTKPDYGRDVIFVTRKSGLGTLLGRCKSLVIDEGYTHLTFHALSAAIPQALLLLHALLDVLPYPRGRRGMWYEIRTGSVECVDEVPCGAAVPPIAAPNDKATGKAKTKAQQADGLGGMEIDSEDKEDGADLARLLAGIGGVEEDEPKRQIRSSIQINLHMGPRPPVKDILTSPPKAFKQLPPGEGKARPNKRRRKALARRVAKERGQDGVEEDEDEEGMMNMGEGVQIMKAIAGGKPGAAFVHFDEEEEEVEE